MERPAFVFSIPSRGLTVARSVSDFRRVASLQPVPRISPGTHGGADTQPSDSAPGRRSWHGDSA